MEVMSCSDDQQTKQNGSSSGRTAELPLLETAENQIDNEGTGIDLLSSAMDELKNTEKDSTLPCLNANSLPDTIKSESLSNNGDDDSSSLVEPMWLQQDEPVALWVKWRGIWQAGIRCARADWPLATLRGKPTHDRKKYFVVFFPHTKNYSWADMQLVRSINEFPEPIAYKSHKVGLKMVKDLTAARNYTMRKLVIGMLNIVDQFRSEVFVENAREITVWKEFAKDASRCSGYRDLGRMLLKLQRMILSTYVNQVWLKDSFYSWVQKCNDAVNAESVELLKEELFDSILWNEIKSFMDGSSQSTLFSEWKTWKHEIKKWFSRSHSIFSGGERVLQKSDAFSSPDVQASRKRQKLEIRRADAQVSPVESSGLQQTMSVEIGSDFFGANDVGKVPELQKDLDFRVEEEIINTPRNGLDQGDGFAVEAAGSGATGTKKVNRSVNLLNQNKNVESLTHSNQSFSRRSTDSGNKNRQCTAFIESKGRQCVRWANEGDVYCCVHLASRSTTKHTKPAASPSVETLMCGGITVFGLNCKHRSLPGSKFCKKHRQADRERPSNSSVRSVKRKLEDVISSSEASQSRALVPLRETTVPASNNLDSVLDRQQTAFNERIGSTGALQYYSKDSNLCVGSYSENKYYPCQEQPTRHTLYCDQHLPNWLKRARNGKSRIISKDVFLDLLRVCLSREEKLQLHQACEIFYKLLKGVLSLRNPVPMEVQFQWAILEASKDAGVGEFLMKLVSCERERLTRIWGFSAGENAELVVQPLGFTDMEKTADKEEELVVWRFACAICLDCFTDRKLLESHVEERHHVQFVEKCMLFHCIPCGGHFGNSEQLLSHVESVHPSEIKSSDTVVASQVPVLPIESSGNPEPSVSASITDQDPVKVCRNFTCKLCGLKFDLLPDLGRHHQAEHMEMNLPFSRPQNRGARFYPYRSKSGRLSRPNRFKKGLAAVSYRIRSRANVNMKKRIQVSKSLNSEIIMGLSAAGLSAASNVAESLSRLTDSHCSAVAEVLFSKIQKIKPRPNNLDILSAARSACCKLSLKASLEAIFGILPERMYLKAAKLCSENGIQVQWHQEGFECPNKCKLFKDPSLSSPLVPRFNDSLVQSYRDSKESMNDDWEVDECHCIIDSHHFGANPSGKSIVLCKDISFGQERAPVTCVMDDALLDYEGEKGENLRPWESFSYVIKPILGASMTLYNENQQLGCGCLNSACSPESCDHVYLFDTDFEDARDMYGRPMRCRFPYDEKGRIILEEGYPVYECNQMCRCNKACRNRVLQNGVRAKLEVFKTKSKGWGVRAGEPILRGTFICEFVGEILDEQEANNRRSRYKTEVCSYIYNVDEHKNDISRLVEGEPNYVIDATMYGNVSRFIKHSCSPNLVTYQVLVQSMESPLAHIGLFAGRDISTGEELTCDYGNEPTARNGL